MEKLSVQDLAMFIGRDALDSEYPEEGVFPITLGCLLTYEQADDETYPKPILRPLSDMTIEERSFVGTYNYGVENFTSDGYGGDSWMNIIEVSNKVKYLCSKGIDVFGWIEKGLAIDKTKL